MNGKKRKVKADKTETSAKTKVSEKDGEESRLQVIAGSRKRRRIIRWAAYGMVALIVILLIVINALTPTGLVETIQNDYAALGGGSLPVNVYSHNCSEFYSYNGAVCMVNDSYFELYNKKGKLIQAVSHGMLNPRLEVSEARFLLFDRDRYAVKVYNYSDELYALSFDQVIISADIGRNGTFAVVTASDSYRNTVYVYNKKNELVYTWNSANYYITDVAVSDNGKKIAVCMLDSSGGSYVSRIFILKFNSASPVETYEFTGLISSASSSGDYMLVNGIDTAYSVPWDGGAAVDLNVTGNIRCYDFEEGGITCIAYGRESNEQINTVCVLNEKGQIQATFNANVKINDVDVSEEHVAVLSDDSVFLYDIQGTSEKRYYTEAKGRFAGLTDKGLLVVDNARLCKIDLNQAE